MLMGLAKQTSNGLYLSASSNQQRRTKMPFIRLRNGEVRWIEPWMLEMIAAEPPQLRAWLREDARAFALQRQGQSASANVRVVGAPSTVTVGEPAAVKPSGWVDPLPLKSPPGVARADKIVDGQDRKDRVEAAFRRRLKP
jgi:hypothetical protein